MHHATKTDRSDYNVTIGTELPGVKLSQLSDDEVVEIKQLAAERGVLFFRDQTMTLEEQVELGRRFGDLHIHPSVRPPEGVPPEILVVHADADSTRVNGEGWHSDVSCEERPPALSMLRIETAPQVGGDTLFASMYGALEALSLPMQTYLVGLTARHDDRRHGNRYQGDSSRTFPETDHPVVRTHPDTGRKALYVNTHFTHRINDIPPQESDRILRFIYDHIAYGVQFQTRFRWGNNSVAIWDNRCVQHNPAWDYFPQTRHGYRVTTIGERPYQ